MSGGVLGIIFSDMHDGSLHELTSRRTTASVPFGGKYRLIDFVLSNMYNSGITEVGVITKNNYQSLMDHLGSGKDWDLSHKREGLYILPPFGRAQSGVYKGRLEALYGISEFIHRSKCRYVVMSDCDTICNLDFSDVLESHVRNGADITAIYKRRELQEGGTRAAIAYGVDGSGRVNEVMINPKCGGKLNLGINMWIMNKPCLENIIDNGQPRSLQSFERDVLQKDRFGLKLFGWEFDGYAGQINTMQQYFKTNMDLLDSGVRRELFYRYGHIYTKVRDEVPAKYAPGASIKDSLIADGCVIEGSVENCIVFRGVKVRRGARVSNSIIMQGTSIDENTKLDYVVIDKDAFVKENRVLSGYETYPMFIGKGCIV